MCVALHVTRRCVAYNRKGNMKYTIHEIITALENYGIMCETKCQSSATDGTITIGNQKIILNRTAEYAPRPETVRLIKALKRKPHDTFEAFKIYKGREPSSVSDFTCLHQIIRNLRKRGYRIKSTEKGYKI